MNHDFACCKENSFEELGVGLVGLEESRAPIQIASSQEDQRLETAFGFILVVNKAI